MASRVVRRAGPRSSPGSAVCATGQFGKNHLGDRDEHLPTMHGFDEFFGNLYHLNAEEEPELRDYPPEADFPEFKQKYGPRGVLHCWADGKGRTPGR
jgi:arylsulfatase